MDNKTFNGFAPCDAAHWQLLQGWWASFQGAILPLLSRNPTMGAWVASCFVHEINVRGGENHAQERGALRRHHAVLRLRASLADAWPTRCPLPHPLPFYSTSQVDYCSGQSLPNCRGWKKYTVKGAEGSLTLSAAFPQWFAATVSDWERVSTTAASLATRALLDVVAWRSAGSPASGPWASEAQLTPYQLVDALRYPNNPSCIYPPG